MDVWISVPDPSERRKRITSDLDLFMDTLDESWKIRFSVGLKNALVDKLCDQQVLEVLRQLREQQHQLESEENNARTELLKSLQLDPEIDSKMCQNDSDIVAKIDKAVENQQLGLQKMDLPAFRVTQNKRELELQCKILEFVHCPL
ncbi:hypothetical protein PFISCL1PPCAC_24749, partial [Pristionchus fissidentatus]